jgi:hypothetical protein
MVTRSTYHSVSQRAPTIPYVLFDVAHVPKVAIVTVIVIRAFATERFQGLAQMGNAPRDGVLSRDPIADSVGPIVRDTYV